MEQNFVLAVVGKHQWVCLYLLAVIMLERLSSEALGQFVGIQIFKWEQNWPKRLVISREQAGKCVVAISLLCT